MTKPDRRNGSRQPDLERAVRRMERERWARHANNKTYDQWLAEQSA